MPGTADNAEALALSAVQFLASDSDRLQHFLDSSGIMPDALRARLSESAFLAGVLDYLSSDEALLVEFAAWATIAPAAIGVARRKLGGPEATD